jgi:aldehyde dehydrogenase (NAD+)
MKDQIQRQRDFFNSGATRDLKFRKKHLNALLQTIVSMESDVLEALHKDMGKPQAEGLVSELALVYDEIRHAIRHLGQWAKPIKVGTPLLQFPGSSHIYFEPYGVALIIGPWNYPFQLIMAPLVAAIAAGNCAVLKPSELAPRTADVIAKIIVKAFEPSVVSVFLGGVPVSKQLLEERFDYMFFTGGPAVGRIVMEAATKNLTPLTLELGGKSPCIVDSDVDLDVTARRIAWGKFFNAGQTCVAPDYMLVPKDLKKPLIAKLKEQIHQFFGEDPATSPDYARIINASHFKRLEKLISQGRAVIGGETDEKSRYIAPTILDDVDLNTSLMKDEIFGPLLPILTYRDFDEAVSVVKSRPRPLALYLFSNLATSQRRVVQELSFGGGCINDTLVHLANPELPFGGVGESGMGSYHGHFGFETFSHRKSVTKRPFSFDFKMRYPPYRVPIRQLRWLLRAPARSQ